MVMGVLSDSEVLDYMKDGKLKIEPFASESLGPAGYDLRLGSSLLASPGKCMLAHTLELLEIGASICGQIFLRSSFAREGLVGNFALVDPGFRGQLTLPIINMGLVPVELKEGERIAQIVFHKLDRLPNKTYSGKYQNSLGAVGSKRHM
jgi:dCTP deaminase